MAQVIIAYEDGAGTKYGVSEEQGLQDLFVDFATAAGQTLSAPFNTSYASLAALQAVSGWSGAIAAPAGLNPRKITVQLAEATGAALSALAVVVGLPATFTALEPTGATPFPTSNFTLTTMAASLIGVAGESRAGN